MFANFGPTELIILLVIVLLIFGPKRLPGLGRSLGSGMREFKDSITGKDRGRDEDEEEERPRPAALEQPAATNHDDSVRAAEAEPARERSPQS